MSYSSEVLADSPLAYWRLGESSGTTMTDSSGNGRNGTYVGGVTLGAPSLTADADTAATFDGSTGYATVADASWQTQAAISAEAIIKPAALGSSYRAVFTADSKTSTNRGWNLYVFNGKLRVLRSTTIIDGTTTLTVGNTYHVAFTYDGTTVRVYLNGTLEVSVAAATLPDGVYGMLVGMSWAGGSAGSFKFNGVIDEVAFYGSALSGTRLAAHAAAMVSSEPVGPLAVTLPTLAADGSGIVQPFGPLDSTLPALISSASGDATILGPLDSALPALSAQFAGGPVGGPVAGSLDATLPALTVSTDTADLDGGVGFAEELPDDDLPPAEIPDPRRLIRTVAWSVPPIELDGNGRPTEAWKAGAQKFEGVWGAYRLLVGGEDVTLFRGMPAQFGVREHKSPFSYQALEVTIPGVTPWTWFQRETDPAVSSWLGNWKSATVVLQVVDEAGVPTVLWRGYIAAPNPSPAGLHLTCAGEARGRLEMDYKTIRPFMFRKDVGVCLYDLARRPGLRITPALGVETGIPIDERTRTSGTLLDCVSELISLSENDGGDTLTFTPTGAHGNVYQMHYQDNETVDYTVFYGAYGIDASDLQDNIIDHPTTLHGFGRESDGGFWANIKAPGLFEAAPPPFPGTLSHGDTGADVNTLKARLEGLYLDRQDSHDEVGFGDATEEAVKDLQDDMGHAQTGVVDLATWNAAWDIDITGTSLTQAHSEPLAQNNNTKRFNVTASGAIAGPNPDYDPRRPKVTEVTDYGFYSKRQARKRARRRRQRLAQEKSYSGNLRIDSDLFLGDYHHGDPDPVVVSRFVPLDGKNIMLRGFEGDLLLHVAGDTKDERGATVPASSMALPGLEIRQKVERNKEGRGNPALTWRRTHRGTEIPGPIDFWSEIGGYITTRQTLEGGKWNVLDPVVAGDMGTLAQVGLELEDAVEFVAVLFAVPVNQAWVRDTLPDPFAMPKAWQHTTVRQLRKTIMLEFWGDKDNPAGYGPDGSKADGDPVAGILLDQAGIPYRTFARDDINNGKRCLLYWAVHPKTDTAIGPQRCLWPNPEVGM